MNNSLSLLDRRAFCRTAAGAAALCAAPLILPARLLGAGAPSRRLRVGQIGCGRIARDHDMSGVIQSGMADIVAVCDVDRKRAESARQHVATLCAKYKQPAPPSVAVTTHYKELLALPDLDAVVISTPDHWHAEPAVAAALAGKDIYIQKPLAMTIAEGILVERTVREKGRILQVGSQQRSSKQFRRACELVRSGRVGRLRRVEIGLPTDPTAADNPEQPVPANLDYDQWLGATAPAYYTEQRVHPQNDFSRPGWLRNEAYCLGMITGWGSHHFDIAHWGMDLEHTGPSKIEGKGEFPTNKIWNVHGAYRVELTYPGDILATVCDKFPNGVRFIGDEGWIFVSRGDVKTTASDPVSKGAKLKALDASKPALIAEGKLSVELPRSEEHHLDWILAVQKRTQPIAPIGVAHRSFSACALSWIAMKLARPLRWDAKAERFVGDDEANALLARPERAPYGVTRLLSSMKA